MKNGAEKIAEATTAMAVIMINSLPCEYRKLINPTDSKD
jgi:hypothetical protein